MTYRLVEKPDGTTTSINPPGISVAYASIGEADKTAVFAYTVAGTPSVMFGPSGTLYRNNIATNHRGHDVYDVTVSYGPQPRVVGEFRFAFSTMGGTLHITQAKAHVATFPSASAPDHKGAIGFDGVEVRGTDITIPALKLTYTFRHPQGAANEALALKLAKATGKTNSAKWHGLFDIGSLLFLGCNGSQGTTSEAEIQYEFAYSEGLTLATIGAITNVNKKGWEIAWIEYEEGTSGTSAVKTPKWIHVDRVYDSMDYATELGF